MALVQTQFLKKIKTIRSDNGTDFVCLTRFFLENGIHHETSCVYTPQQNRRVERKHILILNVARALRFQAHLPIEYWGECVKAAVYLMNRTPSQLLDGKTPFEKLYGREPSVRHLRVFGCLAYAHNINHAGDKFAPKSRRCVFLGYPSRKKGWLLYDLEKRVIFHSRDVVFSENQFLFANQSNGRVSVTPEISPEFGEISFDDSASEDIETATVTEKQSIEQSLDGTVTAAPNDPSTEVHNEMVSAVPAEMIPTNNIEVTVMEPPTSSAPAETSLGRGHRQKTQSTRLKDYVVNTVTIQQSLSLSSTSPTTQLSSGSVYPLSDYLSSHKFSPNHRSFLASISSHTVPRTFLEAMEDDIWKGAMGSEYTALDEQHTWDLEPLPPNKRALNCQWIYSWKYRADGTVERPKARLVVCGNRQKLTSASFTLKHSTAGLFSLNMDSLKRLLECTSFRVDFIG